MSEEKQLSPLNNNGLPSYLANVEYNTGVEEAELAVYMTSFRIINPTAKILQEDEESFHPDAKAGYWMDLAKNISPQAELNLIVVKIVTGYSVSRHVKGEEPFYGGFVREDDPIMEGSIEGSNFAERIIEYVPEGCEGEAVARKSTLLCCIEPETGMPCSVMVSSYSNNNVAKYAGPITMRGEQIFAKPTLFTTKSRKNDYGSTNYDAVLTRGEGTGENGFITPKQAEQAIELNKKLQNKELFNQFAGRFNFEKQLQAASENDAIDAAVNAAME